MLKHTAVFLGTMLLTVPVASATLTADTEQAPAAPATAQAAVARGASVAWLDLQRIVESSAEGKIANAKVQALTQKKSNEIGEKTKQLQAAQQKLQTSGTVLSEAAQGVLQKEIDRLNVDIQRMQQDAQAEVQDLQLQLQNEFQKKLMPVIETLVKERNISLLFSRNDAGIVYGDPGLDLTEEVVKRFDATAVAAPPPASAPKPPAAAPAPAPTPKPPAATPPPKPPAGGQTPPPGGNP
jgi:outer membrane protein